MAFDGSEIKKVAQLARLQLNDQETQRLQDDLNRIVSFVDQLKQVDVENVKPMSHAGDRVLTLREDCVHEVLGREGLRSSQGYDDGLIRIPKIID